MRRLVVLLALVACIVLFVGGQSLATLETEPPRLQAQTRRLVRMFAVVGGTVSVLAVLLYSAHLALLLFWLHDRSVGSRATYELLSFIGQSFGLATSLLELEPVSDALERLVDAISPVVGAGV